MSAPRVSAKKGKGTSGPRPQSHDRNGALFAMALGTFAVGTEGFMIAAILPQIAASLRVSVPVAGQLVTVFTLVYALSSPFLTAMTAGRNRRTLLLGALGAFILANLVAAIAPNYLALIGARVLLALAAGLYVPNASALAGSLVSPAKRGRALAIVNGGITVAVALGVPAGAFVGANFGWRATFVGVAILSSIALLVLFFRIPRDAAGSAPASLKDRLGVIHCPGAIPVLLITTITAAGAYTVYTYVSPFLSVSTGLSPEHAGMMVTLVGISAAVGVWVGGYATDHIGARHVQAIAFPAMVFAFAGLTIASLLFSPNALYPLVPLMILWGASAWGYFPAQQHRLISVTGLNHAAVALSLNASFLYLGFALGAALGSLVITFGSVQWIGAAGGACVIVAGFISHAAWKRLPPDATG